MYVCAYMHSCVIQVTCIHTYVHTYMQTDIHSRHSDTHAYIQTYRHRDTDIYIYMYIAIVHIYVYTHYVVHILIVCVCVWVCWALEYHTLILFSSRNHYEIKVYIFLPVTLKAKSICLLVYFLL